MIRVPEIEELFDINRQIGMWQTQYTINGAWTLHQREITDQDIKDHLAGRWWIATRPRGTTLANVGSGATCRWLIIDIDDHGERSERYGPIESRMHTVFRLLNATPIVFSSPTGNGKHIYYRCPKEIPVGKILTPVTNHFMLKDVFLAKDGIELHPQAMVLFRLPFGKLQNLERIGSSVYEKPLSGLDAFLEIKNKIDEIWTIQPNFLSSPL